MERGKEFLRSIFGREGDLLSRRDALAGLGLAGLLLATPKLFATNPAEAKAPDKPAEAAATSETKAADPERVEEAALENAGDSDVTELSSRRRWWRRRWRRRYWRRRWRRRWWRRRRWHRRRWWRRRWRRRYW